MYVRARFAERRLWLDLAVAFWQNLLPADRIDIMCALTVEYAPSQSRLYETVANFLNDKGYPFKTGRNITCDYCGCTIICDRYRCITCMKEDLSNQIDLCSDTPKCIESASYNTQHDFVHTPSHTLLRQKFFLHKIYLSGFISHCRNLSENIKKRFRFIEQNKKMAKKTAKASKSGKTEYTSQIDEASGVQPPFCVCCEKHVSLPCWICATCVAETAVCMDCELKRAKVVKYENRGRVHSHNHLLLRISDSEEIQSREVNNTRLQRELISITTDLRTLEKKVTTHLRAANKVNAALRRFTVNGEVKVVAEHHLNGESTVDGEAAIVQQDDDNPSTSGSAHSSDTEGIVGVTAPNTLLLANPQTLSVDAGAEARGVAEAAAKPETITPEAPVNLLLVIDSGTLMNTAIPTSAPFFEPFMAEPVPSATLENGGDLPEMANEHTSAPEQEQEGVLLEYSQPTRMSGSRQLSNHLVSIDAHISSHETRFSSIDTRISSLDTRISSLDNRLSGMENQLGQILSLLSQSHS